MDLEPFKNEDYCYLTTRGHKTGSPHEIEIWFGVQGNSIYLMSGGGDKSHWVRNLMAADEATVRLRGGGVQAVRSVRLASGPERDGVIRATFRQHAFPGNVVYYLARQHITAVGEFFRLDPVGRA